MENRKNRILEVKGVQIKKGWMRNFSGCPDKYHTNGGVRFFSFIINDEDMANQLIEDGWKVKRYVRDEESDPEYTLNVKIGRFIDYIKRVDDQHKRPLDLIDPDDPEDQNGINCLDYENIGHANLRITGRLGDDGLFTAYLKAGVFVVEVDDLLSEFAEEEYPEEVPFD